MSTTRPARSLTARLVTAGVAVAAVGAASMTVVQTSRAAFSATTSNAGSTATAGTVALSDDDAGSVLFDVTNMKPGDTVTRCVNVSYGGSLAADVRLYGTAAGTGLADHLDTTVEIGTGATGGASLSCTGFSGGTSLFANTLSAFAAGHTNYADGVRGFATATPGAARSYRVAITLRDTNAAQGKNATMTFTWEAQNT